MNQQQSSSQPRGNSLKWLLIILAVVVVFGGSYLLYAKYGKSTNTATTTTSPTATTSTPTTATTTPTTTTDKTAGWKTYTDSTYGYSIEYPTDITKSDDKGASSEPNRLSWIEFSNSNQYGGAVIVVEVLKNTYTDISDWATKENNNDLGATYSVKDVTVGGVAGQQLSTDAEGGAIRTGVIKGDRLYIIHQIGTVASWTDLKNTAALKEIYNTILSAFQFTK